MNKLVKIQAELKAPKNQFNSFGKYKYRSCEDIVEAVKPLLAEYNMFLIMDDHMVEVGGRVYVQSETTIYDADGQKVASSTACAREAVTKKGMDDAQITGSASSYARKYALNGLFAIDDTKDADATNKHGKEKAETVAIVKEVFAPNITKTPKEMVDRPVENKFNAGNFVKKYSVKKGDIETWYGYNRSDIKAMTKEDRDIIVSSCGLVKAEFE